MTGLGYFLLIVVVLGAMSGIIVHLLVRMLIVPEHRIGLLYRNGRFVRRLEPGKYYRLKLSTIWTLKLYDMRRTILVVPGQELLSSDNVGLKVSVAVSYEVNDPELLENCVQDYRQELHTAVQLALRSAVGKLTIEDVLLNREEMGEDIFKQVVGQVEPIGLKIHYVEIKDVMFPGDLKRIFNEVIKARKEVQAVMEKARGETAALRHLANAAKILKNNSELLDLKVLQTMSSGSGNTYVMGVSQGIVPVGVKSPSNDEGEVEK